MKVELLIIDPQVDFCDPNGTLYVPGADNDIGRLSDMIDRIGHKLFKIHVTLDMHHLFDISHPLFWIDTQGNHLAPFTRIKEEDVISGKYRTTNPLCQQRAVEYERALKKNNRYPHLIWPPHCLIGSRGSTVMPELFDTLIVWEEKRVKMVNYVTKGSNFWTEHYSAVKADVPDPADDGTMLNAELVDTLQEANIIAISGQAINFCVANTVKDIADNFGEENVKKLVLLEDTSSEVPGFEDLTKQFMDEMLSRGMRTAKSTDFLA